MLDFFLGSNKLQKSHMCYSEFNDMDADVISFEVSRSKLTIPDSPDCGLKTRGMPETEASLRNLVEAAGIVREEL